MSAASIRFIIAAAAIVFWMVSVEYRISNLREENEWFHEMIHMLAHRILILDNDIRTLEKQVQFYTKMEMKTDRREVNKNE